MRRKAAGMRLRSSLSFVSLLTSPALAAGPWADQVVQYTPGTGILAGYDQPGAALGSPSRITGVDSGWVGSVTPFNPAYEARDIVSLGSGGSLTVKFSQTITNDGSHLYGADLLVFAYSFYTDPSFGGVAQGYYGRMGTIELSADGTHWTTVTPLGSLAAGFPTLGYSDVADPYGGSSAGTVPTDFTKPVDPSLNLLGKSYADMVAAYAGSGGGLSIDIGAAGLTSVNYVRVTNTGAGTVSIDGFAAVPTPASLACVLGGSLVLRGRRRA